MKKVFLLIILSISILLICNYKIYASESITLREETGFKIEDSYLTGIEEEREVSSFDLGLDTSYTIVILDKNNTAKTSGYIFTGDKVQVKKGSTKVGEYTVLILGDTNGDGKISSLDYVKIKNHIMGTSISGEVYLKSADCNSDNKISSLDYVKVKNYIMGKSTTKYTITYNANGGSGTMSKQSVTANITTNLLRNKFTKEGNTFNGWSTKADGSGTTYKDVSKIKVIKNITLYAQWNAISGKYANVDYSNFQWTTYNQNKGPLLDYYKEPVPYAIYAPKDGVDLNGVSLPIFVWLHGKGQTKENGGSISDVVTSELPKTFTNWKDYNLAPAPGIVVAPQQILDTNNSWAQTRNIETIKALIKYVKDAYNADTSRVVLMGHSYGGNGAFRVANSMQDYFYAVIASSSTLSDTSSLDYNYFSKLKIRGYSEFEENRTVFTWMNQPDSFIKVDASHAEVPVIALTEDANKDGVSDLMYWLFGNDAFTDNKGEIKKLTQRFFIGDSRTTGMFRGLHPDVSASLEELAQGKVTTGIDTWSCQSGSGFNWMKDTGIPNIEDKLDNNSALIILSGANEVSNIDNISLYVNYFNEKMPSWKAKGAKIYFVSIMPFSGNYASRNAKAEKYNESIRAVEGINYIDTYTYLNEIGFYSNDGLHYINTTYEKIYKFIIARAH